ncbi:MAG: hypothetical protein WCF90_03800 [Methanomicrobiales archaeon]
MYNNKKKGVLNGIFDKLTGKTATRNLKSAMVLSPITVIPADGVIDQAKMNDLPKICRGDQKSIYTAMQVLKGNTFPCVIDMIAAVLDERQKNATLAILCDFAMPDGVLAGEKRQFFRWTWTSSVSPSPR